MASGTRTRTSSTAPSAPGPCPTARGNAPAAAPGWSSASRSSAPAACSRSGSSSGSCSAAWRCPSRSGSGLPSTTQAGTGIPGDDSTRAAARPPASRPARPRLAAVAPKASLAAMRQIALLDQRIAEDGASLASAVKANRPDNIATRAARARRRCRGGREVRRGPRELAGRGGPGRLARRLLRQGRLDLARGPREVRLQQEGLQGVGQVDADGPQEGGQARHRQRAPLPRPPAPSCPSSTTARSTSRPAQGAGASAQAHSRSAPRTPHPRHRLPPRVASTRCDPSQ